MAWGDDDPFDYDLALHLGWSHAAVKALDDDEYVRWRAYWNHRHNQRAHEEAVAAMRAGKGT